MMSRQSDCMQAPHLKTHANMPYLNLQYHKWLKRILSDTEIHVNVEQDCMMAYNAFYIRSELFIYLLMILQYFFLKFNICEVIWGKPSLWTSKQCQDQPFLYILIHRLF